MAGFESFMLNQTQMGGGRQVYQGAGGGKGWHLKTEDPQARDRTAQPENSPQEVNARISNTCSKKFADAR